MNPTVAYASFCCAKDMERAIGTYWDHQESHNFPFPESLFIFQRCFPNGFEEKPGMKPVVIQEADYAKIMEFFRIEYPNPVLDELTHGWGAPHFWAHHMVNHLQAAIIAETDYIVFADADCHMKSQPENRSWIDAGIALLEARPELFVISPNEGGPERLETIMSQQMFLVNRKRFLEMEFIPWDGKFIEGGPFQEYYALLEGFIGRFMAKNGLFRYVLPAEFRYWHKAWH